MIKNLFITILASFISLVMASTAFAGGHINWSEVETKAKEEGEVFWFNWYLEEPLQNFAKRFEDEELELTQKYPYSLQILMRSITL